MSALKNAAEIQKKITAVEEKLEIIETKIAEELTRPFSKRRYFVFDFLNQEKNIYSAALNELKWVLNE